MSKIILINPSCSIQPGKGSIILKQLPYGVAIVNAVLKKENFDTRLVDLDNKVKYYYGDIPDKSFDLWLTKDMKDDHIKEYLAKSLEVINPNSETRLIGISVTYKRHYPYALTLAKEIKHTNPAMLICLGGSYMPYVDDLPPYIDYIVKGCGSDPMISLCNHIFKNAAFNPSCKGLSYRDANDKLVDNGTYSEQAENELLPDFSDLNIEDYIVRINKFGLNKLDFKDFVVASYRTHTGCTGGCSFCGVNMNEKIARKSPEKAFNELKALSKIYSNVYIQFNDSAINNFQDDFSKILDLIIEKNMKIPFFAFINMKNVTEEFIYKLAKAGCNRLFWGIEHFSSDMLKLFNKYHYEFSKVDKIIGLSSALGILNQVSLILNAPGEKMKDVKNMKKSYIRLLRHKNVIMSVASFEFEAFSPMAKHPEKYNIQKYQEGIDGNEIKKIGWKPINDNLDDFLKKYEKTERIKNKLKRLKNFIEHARLIKLNLPYPVLRSLFIVKDSLRFTKKNKSLPLIQ